MVYSLLAETAPNSIHSSASVEVRQAGTSGDNENYHDCVIAKEAAAALPEAASILTTLVGLLDDDRPESERVARELRKRLERARHLAEDVGENSGKAVHARKRAALSTGEESRKWSQRADLAEARAAGYRSGLQIVYEEMAMLAAQPLDFPDI